MQGFDAQKEQRVWARVQARSEETAPDFRGPWQLAAELDALYRHLPERDGRRLRQSLGRTLRCLRGLQKLTEQPQQEPIMPAVEKPRRLIPTCWHRERQLQEALRTADGTYKPMFEQLRQESALRCLQLAERMGAGQ